MNHIRRPILIGLRHEPRTPRIPSGLQTTSPKPKRTGFGNLIPVAVLSAGLAFFVFGVVKLKLDNEDVLRWLPDRSAARDDYEHFQRVFGADDFVVVSWEQCTVDDPRLTAFVERLRGPDSSGLLHSVRSGNEVLEVLVREGGQSDADVRKRLAGVFFGIGDSRLTCTVIELSKTGTARRADAIAFIEKAAASVPGIDTGRLMVAGYPWVSIWLNRMLEEMFRRLLLASAVASTLVALACLRNVRLALLGLIASATAAGCTLGIIPAMGGSLGGLTMIVPTLSFVMTMSGTLHLIRYALDCGGDQRRLLKEGWKPCSISALTTIIGVLTLVNSNCPAVREFGAHCAAGMVYSWLVQLSVVPWLLVRFGQSGLAVLQTRASSGRFWSALPAWIESRRMPVIGLGLLVFFCGIAGLLRLKSDFEAENMFQANAPVMEGVRRLENQLGPMEQTEAMLEFENAPAEGLARRLQYVRQFAGLVKQLPGVVTVHSLADWIPRQQRGIGVMGHVRQRVYEDALFGQRDELTGYGLFSLRDGRETWRISLRFSFNARIDMQEVEKQVRQLHERFAASASRQWQGFAIPRIVYTGTTHLVRTSQRTLLRDFASNFLLALAIITPVLVVVLRSVWMGLIGMFVNLMPIATVFGALGWLGVPVDIAIGMTASIALGIAVDDTTHFMIRFQEEGGRWGSPYPAIERAISLCGPAMVHTTWIACSGIFTFWFGDLVMVSRFAAMIALLLTAALLADVILLPAILLSGRRNR